jgi:hypothetical protein
VTLQGRRYHETARGVAHKVERVTRNKGQGCGLSPGQDSYIFTVDNFGRGDHVSVRSLPRLNLNAIACSNILQDPKKAVTVAGDR